MNTELCFGQKIDESLGILFPWYTHGALEVISKFDLSDKVIMEWGGGASTLWWAVKSKFVFSTDHNNEWVQSTIDELTKHEVLGKSLVGYTPTHEGDQSIYRDNYVDFYNSEEISLFLKKESKQKVNIAIVDGIHRYECSEYAVKVIKPEILIIDNHQQDYVFICPKLDELLEGVRMERFIQPDHENHEGRPWATAIFYLNEKA